MQSKHSLENPPSSQQSIPETSSTCPLPLPNHTTLYKPKSENARDDSLFSSEDSHLPLISLCTRPGGDFNSHASAWYFTPELAAAERFRKWDAARNRFGHTWIIQIQVPNAFLAGLRRENLDYGEEWREYVWRCRRRKLPWKEVGRDGEDMQVVVGSICRRVPDVQGFEQDVFLSGDELCLMKGNERATQWAFMKMDVVRELEELVKGKCYIEVHLPVEKA